MIFMLRTFFHFFASQMSLSIRYQNHHKIMNCVIFYRILHHMHIKSYVFSLFSTCFSYFCCSLQLFFSRCLSLSIFFRCGCYPFFLVQILRNFDTPYNGIHLSVCKYYRSLEFLFDVCENFQLCIEIGLKCRKQEVFFFWNFAIIQCERYIQLNALTLWLNMYVSFAIILVRNDIWFENILCFFIIPFSFCAKLSDLHDIKIKSVFFYLYVCVR